MGKIANRGEELAKKKFDYVLKELEDMIKDPPTELYRIRYDERNDPLAEEDELCEEDLFGGCDDAHTTRPSNSTADELIKKLSQLKEEIESYCKQMICLGFEFGEISLSKASPDGKGQRVYGQKE